MIRLLTALCLLSIGFVASPALAQHGVLTQNADEPGRNPYQEAQLTNCAGSGDCVLSFATVPTNRRRVVDYVSCEIDVAAANTLILASLGSQTLRLPRASLPFATLPALPTRAMINATVRLYYEAGEQPRVDTYTTDGGTPFLLCTISGYDITLQ